jgi:HEAT repeat protein
MTINPSEDPDNKIAYTLAIFIVAISLLTISLMTAAATDLTVPPCRDLYPELFHMSINELIGEIEKDEGRRGCALDAIRDFGGAGIPGLIKLLQSPDPNVRKDVAATFWNYGDNALQAVPELLHALNDHDERVGMRAAESLGFIRPRSVTVLDALIGKLGGVSRNLALESAIALSKMGPLPEKALEPLLNLVALARNSNVELSLEFNTHIAEAISHIQSDKVISVLIEMIVNIDQDDIVRSRASSEASKFGSLALPILLAEKKKATDKKVLEALTNAIRWGNERQVLPPTEN